MSQLTPSSHPSFPCALLPRHQIYCSCPKCPDRPKQANIYLQNKRQTKTSCHQCPKLSRSGKQHLTTKRHQLSCLHCRECPKQADVVLKHEGAPQYFVSNVPILLANSPWLIRRVRRDPMYLVPRVEWGNHSNICQQYRNKCHNPRERQIHKTAPVLASSRTQEKLNALKIALYQNLW
jgi:hypothetical protein